MPRSRGAQQGGCGVLSRALLTCACAALARAQPGALPLIPGAPALAQAGSQDVLLRSPDMKRQLEGLYRRAVHKRLGSVKERGFFDAEHVTMGWGIEHNWSDVWGPTYACPMIEHIGEVGDGGKWVCGVDQLLQRPGCVIYSVGSFDLYQFEAELLNRTMCDIHVFDPTVLPSRLRAREQELNGALPRRRIWWHSIGIAKADDEGGTIGPACYGSPVPLSGAKPAPEAKPAASSWFSSYGKITASKPLRVDNGVGGLNAVWAPKPRQGRRHLLHGDAGRELLQARPRQITPQAMSEEQNAMMVQLEALDAGIQAQGAACADAASGVRQPSGGVAAASRDTPQDVEAAPYGDDATRCNLMTLPTIMKELGHSWVDVFKIDVEGAEYGAFEALAAQKDAMRFTQLQVEVHFGKSDGFAAVPNANLRQFELLRSLMANGFRTFNVEPNIYTAGQTCFEFALVRMDECGNVVTPR